MDETEYEDGETEGGALSAASSFETPEQYRAAFGVAIDNQRRAAQQEAQTRRQAYEQAQRYIEQNSFGRPTQSEQLMRLSQALLSPRRSRGFGATLANVVPALAENQQLSRQADEQRAEALMRLQQEYATGTAAAGTAAASAEVDALQGLATHFRQPAPQRGTWSENLGRFVREGEPVRIEAEDKILANGQVFSAFRTATGMIYRGVVNGQPVTVDENGNPVQESQ